MQEKYPHRDQNDSSLPFMHRENVRIAGRLYIGEKGCVNKTDDSDVLRRLSGAVLAQSEKTVTPPHNIGAASARSRPSGIRTTK